MRLGQFFQTADNEGREKHTPIIECPASVAAGEYFDLYVTVGKEVPHPNKPEHHIKWVQLFGRFESGQVVHLATFDFAPTLVEPRIKATLVFDRPVTIFALAFCNIHGLWENYAEIKVQ